MASETDAKVASSDEKNVARSWSRVASCLEAAVAAIPRPPYEVITNPKELAKRLKKLSKSLQTRLKVLLEDSKSLCKRIYELLKELISRISDVLKTFYEYISDKVKRFLKWISGIVQNLRKRFEHFD